MTHLRKRVSRLETGSPQQTVPIYVGPLEGEGMAGGVRMTYAEYLERYGEAMRRHPGTTAVFIEAT